MVFLLFLALLGAVNAQTAAMLAGLPLYNNVTAQVNIDLDVQAIFDALNQNPVNYAQALEVFNLGGNALPLTLKSMASGAGKTGPTFGKYRTYFDRADYASAYVLSALQGTGAMQDQSDAARVTAIKTALPTMVINSHVVEILENTVQDCKLGVLTVNSQGPLNVDLAWAYYVGSLEGQGIAGSGMGYLGFTLASEMCPVFHTCTKSYLSPVNANMAALVSRVRLQATRETGECANTQTTVDRIIAQLSVSSLQGLIRGIYSVTKHKQAHAEAWTHLQALLPRLAVCDARATNALKVNLDITLNEPMKQGVSADALVTLLQSSYACLGVTCADVGALAGKTACSDNVAEQDFAFNLKEYRFRRNVLDRAHIDGDVARITSLLAASNFAAAEQVYLQGRDSVHPTTGAVRSLATLIQADQFAGESIFALFSAFYSSPKFAEDFVLGALRGTGVFAGKSVGLRHGSASTALQHNVLFHQVMHKLQQALKVCRASSTEDAVVFVDEAWAFHTGYTAQHMLFAGNIEQCTATSTCVAGRSPVNDRLVSLFTTAQTSAALRDCVSLNTAIPLIRQQMIVQVVQNLLVNLAKIKTADVDGVDVIWGKAWGSAFTLLPYLAACDQEAVDLVRANLDPSRTLVPMQLDSSATLSHALVSAYRCMKVSCIQVGAVNADVHRFCPSETLDGSFAETNQQVGLTPGGQAGVAIACIVVWCSSLFVAFYFAKKHGTYSKIEAARHLGTDTSIVSLRGRENSF